MVSKPLLAPAWPWPCTCSSQEGSLQCSLLKSCLCLGVGVTRKVNNLVGRCDILRWNTAPSPATTPPSHPTFCAPSPTRGSAIAKIVGGNAAKLAHFDPRVTMWVFEEDVGGRKLTEIINTQHENVKYLPGHKLPSNVVSPNTLQGRDRGVCLPPAEGGHFWYYLDLEVSQEGCSRHRALLCTAPKLLSWALSGTGEPECPPAPIYGLPGL